MSVSGHIMEIEKFAIHDGPGIRSTVFLQGCPLRCPWCANPESQIIGRQIMYNVKKCVGCQTCVHTCQNGGVKVQDGKIVFVRGNCRHCGQCIENCPVTALRFSAQAISSDEVIRQVLKDKDYYDVSGGGVTVSGGEPFVQFDFFLDILKQAKVNGLHTAVETTGNTDFSKILEAEPYLDLFLFDMKHLDPEEITRVTKGNGSLIQENFRHLAAIAPKKIIMRVPVIPGFNYASETLEGLIRMAKELDILEVHLLPYHNLGANKYRQLGQTYELEALKMMNKKELEQYTEFGKSLGIHVQAGG